jgi:glycosyltransferase involved in cell wall biosynthesis
MRAQILVSLHIERKVLKHATGVAAYAQSVIEELGEYGLDRGQIKVVGNGVDPGIFHPVKSSQAARQSEPYVFAAARLDVRKGFEDLVEAMLHVNKLFPKVRLYIAGEGPLDGRLRARAADLGLDRTVCFLGYVERAQIVALYQGATVFVHPAHYEGLPAALLEAMSCARAIVSTAVSGALDVIEDGSNGLLVPPRSPKALANAICRLLGDENLGAFLGMGARRTVEERLSWSAVGASYLRCYQALLNGNGR